MLEERLLNPRARSGSSARYLTGTSSSLNLVEKPLSVAVEPSHRTCLIFNRDEHIDHAAHDFTLLRGQTSGQPKELRDVSFGIIRHDVAPQMSALDCPACRLAVEKRSQFIEQLVRDRGDDGHRGKVPFIRSDVAVAKNGQRTELCFS